MRKISVDSLSFLLVYGLCAGLAAATSQTCDQPNAVCPIHIESTGFSPGSDGSWSAFTVQIGSPPQKIPAQFTLSNGQVIVNTNSSCLPATRSSIPACPDPKQLYSTTASTSFKENSTVKFTLPSGAEAQSLGFDNISIASSPYSFVVKNQILFSVNDSRSFQSQIGLGDQNVETDSSFGVANFVGSLLGDKVISSRSWGFKQGAQYRKESGKLTLGGFDPDQFISNTATFDNQRGDFEVRLTSLTSTGDRASSFTPNKVNVRISMNDSFIRLPQQACDNFEQAFGLQFNKDLNMYTLDDKTYSALLGQNPKFTFSLQDLGSSGGSVDIVIPYASLDLQAGPPLAPPSTRYFPLLCDGEPSLGRAFLQEAYLAANYTSKSFQLFQLKKNTSTKFAPAKIAGIAIGGAVFVGLVIAALFEYLMRLHRKKRLSVQPSYRFSLCAKRKSISNERVGNITPENTGAISEMRSPPSNIAATFKKQQQAAERHHQPAEVVRAPYYGPPLVIPNIQQGSSRTSIRQTYNDVSAVSQHPVIVDASGQSPVIYPISPQSPTATTRRKPNIRNSFTATPSEVAIRHRSLGPTLEPKVYIPQRFYSPTSSARPGEATRRASEGNFPPFMGRNSNREIRSRPVPTATHRRSASAGIPPVPQSRHSTYTAYSRQSAVSSLSTANHRGSTAISSPTINENGGSFSADQNSWQQSGNDPFEMSVEAGAGQSSRPQMQYGRRWSHLLS